MANIIERFTTIIKANINDLLDKAEDPSKMIEQYMRDLTEDLAEVREATAGVLAEEARCKRLIDDNVAEIDKYDGLARKALSSGNEDDARKFLAKKQQLQAKNESLNTAYEAARANADKMRQMHDKLVSDIETLKGRKEAIKAKVAVAKTQNKINDMGSASSKGQGAIDAFNRMESKADEMLDRSNAMAELSKEPEDSAADLAKKYEEAGSTAAVDDELAKLKQEMGL